MVDNFSQIIRRKVTEDDVVLTPSRVGRLRAQTSSRTSIYNNNANEMRRSLYTAKNGTAQLCANSDHRIYYYIL